MKPMIPLLFLFIIGCSTSRPLEVSDDQPEIILQTPLPLLGLTSSPNTTKLSVLFHVREDGTVSDAKIVGFSGDPEWESRARHALKQWQFAAVRRDGVPVEAWVRCPVVVRMDQVEAPNVIMLGELSSTSRHEADSLYTLIEKGLDFDILVRQAGNERADRRRGTPDSVDIAMYPRHIREALQSLHKNEFTRPIRVGDRFVIYKRYADITSGTLP